MARFRIIRKSDSIQVYEYEGPGLIEWDAFPFAEYDYVEIDDPNSDPIPTIYGGRRRLTKLEFMGLLSDAEQTIIEAAAMESPSVARWLRVLDWTTPDPDGTSVDLDDSRLIAGLEAMELAGLLGAGRSEEILRG